MASAHSLLRPENPQDLPRSSQATGGVDYSPDERSVGTRATVSCVCPMSALAFAKPLKCLTSTLKVPVGSVMCARDTSSGLITNLYRCVPSNEQRVCRFWALSYVWDGECGSCGHSAGALEKVWLHCAVCAYAHWKKTPLVSDNVAGVASPLDPTRCILHCPLPILLPSALCDAAHSYHECVATGSTCAWIPKTVPGVGTTSTPTQVCLPIAFPPGFVVTKPDRLGPDPGCQCQHGGV